MTRSFIPAVVFLLTAMTSAACGQVVVWDLEQGGNGHAYELVSEPRLWLEASNLALSRTSPQGFGNGQLWSISDAKENGFVTQSLLTSLPSGAWIGFTDQVVEGEWRWVDGTPGVWQDPRLFSNPVQTAYVNWESGVPIDVGDEDYGLTNGAAGTWENGARLGPVGAFIVEYEPGQYSPILDTRTNPANGHVYYLLATSTWTSAESTARSLGGNLVTINDAAEEDWVWSTFNPSGEKLIWIGLNDADGDSTFTWSSGEPVQYTNWQVHQPSGGEFYVQMGYGEIPYPRFWNDLPNDSYPGLVYGVVELSPPARVTGVEVGGLTWVGGPYELPLGDGDQLRPLPWTRTNQLSVQFSQSVTIEGQMATLVDDDGNEYAVFGPTVSPGDEPGTLRASWQLEEFLDSGRYTFRLDDGILNDDNLPLDGDWIDGASAVSGDGTPGGDFVFTFNILAGDANQDGVVNLFDLIEIRNLQGTAVGGAEYSQLHDIDTRGTISIADVQLAGGRLYDVLTVTAPASAAAVPEPCSLILAASALVLGVHRLRRRI